MGNSAVQTTSTMEEEFSGKLQSGSISRKSKSIQNLPQTYSVLPLGLVVDLVANLSLSNLKILSKYFTKNDKTFLYTISPYEKDYLNYIILEAKKDEIKFYGVNYQETLLNCWVLDTVEQIPCTTVRGNILLHWRDNTYTVPLHIPSKCISFQTAKASILSLFTLPSFTFVVCNRIIVHLTDIKKKLFVSFIGHIEKEKLQTGQIQSDTEWDFSDSVLIGKIMKNIVYFVNDSNCFLSNQYPELRDTENQNLIVANGYNYHLNTIEQNINTVTYAYTQSFQSSELNGNPLRTIYFKDFIQIQKTFLVFIGIVNPTVNGKPNTPSFAILGSSDFLDTKTTNRTTPLLVEYVFEKNDTFQEFNNFFFKFVMDKMLIYVPGFAEFLKQNEANQLLSRIFLYDSTKFEYKQEKNELVLKTVPKKMTDKKINELANYLNSKVKEYFDKLPHFSENKFIRKRDLSPATKYFGTQYLI